MRICGRKNGSTAVALVEGPSKENPLVWEARLEGMAPEIDGKLYLTDMEVDGQAAQPGDVARVQITKTDAYDLIGRVVEIFPCRAELRGLAAAQQFSSENHPIQQLTRISTGAALRVLS